MDDRLATFAELSVREDVTAGEVVAVLEDYARGGWAIHPPTVIELLRRVEVTDDLRAGAKSACETGIQKQIAHPCPQAAQEYREVLHYLST